MISKNFFPVVLISSLFLIIGCSVVIASDEENTLQKGNTYYREGAYDKAIEEYKKLVDEGYIGTSLFYNMGNANYRIGKIGYAILYYEKALELSPSDEDVKHNLDFAHLSTVDRIQPLPRFFLFDWWEALLGLFSDNGWVYVVFVLYLLVILLVGAYSYSKTVKQQKIFFFSGISCVFLLAFSISLLVIKVNREVTLKSGVIVEQFVTVKFSPDSQSTDAFVIHEGLKVNLEDQLDKWIKIRLANGKVGWVEQTYVEQI
ncbi:MAG: tetratricopeptide repeat protein [Ignavibacteriaceae bacterium]